ncbi:hypothetical protein HMPREF9554_00609 [Treponema phagedenis F0421]|nr:hypothetical protein HMPREF9554_00609 [Treponema phagedenis F0421]
MLKKASTIIDCSFSIFYGKLPTVAPCRALFYKTFYVLVRCIKKI